MGRHRRRGPFPEETPIALTYGRSTFAVMMATPADLTDFAIGFSLSEGIVQRPGGNRRAGGRRGCRWRRAAYGPGRGAAIQPGHGGNVASPAQGDVAFAAWIALRKRCVRCPRLACGRTFSPADIQAALAAMPEAQRINALTRAVHAAAFWTPGQGLVALREDVGRHNALDKLVGAMAVAGHRAADGIVLLSSRVSVEMVQKAAVLGAPLIVAVSAPTALAVRVAEAAGMTLIGIARA